jgi:hypothetical protein
MSLTEGLRDGILDFDDILPKALSRGSESASLMGSSSRIEDPTEGLPGARGFPVEGCPPALLGLLDRSARVPFLEFMLDMMDLISTQPGRTQLMSQMN